MFGLGKKKRYWEEDDYESAEEEAAEEERVGAEEGENVFLGQLEVHSVQELVPERREAVGEDGINENRPRRKGVERSVF